MKEPPMSVNPALSILFPLAGNWIVEIIWSEKTHKLVGGPASVRGSGIFDWTCDHGFFLHTTGGDGAPKAHWMIGRDDTSGAFTAIYADERGASRIYGMSFADDIWKMWRNAPGFHQRFEGHLSPNRNAVEARWERSIDGIVWENDFTITYTRREIACG